MSESAARAQAEYDVTAVLRDAGADPAQIPDYMRDIGTAATWLLIIIAGYALVQILILGKAWRQALTP